MSAKMNRLAQRMLASIGAERIENDEVTIKGVRMLLSRRGIELLNQQANENDERLAERDGDSHGS